MFFPLALQKAGARVEERLPAGLNRANELWHEIAGADGGAWLKRLLDAAGTPNGGTVSGWFADAKPVSAERLTLLVEQLDEVHGLQSQWRGFGQRQGRHVAERHRPGEEQRSHHI